jgi:hypothetical protein
MSYTSKSGNTSFIVMKKSPDLINIVNDHGELLVKKEDIIEIALDYLRAKKITELEEMDFEELESEFTHGI